MFLPHLVQQEICKVFRLHLNIIVILEYRLRQLLLLLVSTEALGLQNESSTLRSRLISIIKFHSITRSKLGINSPEYSFQPIVTKI